MVSDTPIPGVNNTDSDLINAWGIAFNPDGFVWVADNGSGKATLYDGDGKKNENLIVTIPGPDTATNSKPTGIVFFGGQNSFIVTEGQNTGPARFIFSTANGTIATRAPNVMVMGHALQSG